MPVPGITREWRRKVLQDAITAGMRAAFYTRTANMDRNAITAYTTANELTDPGYTAGGYLLTPTLITADTGMIIDLADLTVNGMSATNWDTILVYLPGDANRAFAVFEIVPATFSNKIVNIRFPPPSVDAAIVRILG